MYSLMNESSSLLLDELKTKEISRFAALHQQLTTTDVSINPEYHREYKAHWGMHAAFLDEVFYKKYFRRLEDTKSATTLDVHGTLRDVSMFAEHDTGKGIQFSFATKLLTTIDPRLPVYDSKVAAFYFFEAPPTKQSAEKRLDAWLSFYDFLRAEYAHISEAGLLQPAIQAFCGRFPNAATWPEERIIDVLIWATVSSLESGLLHTGKGRHH